MNRTDSRSVALILALYAAVGVLWAVVSELVLQPIAATDAATYYRWATTLHVAFVVVSLALLGVPLWRALARRRRDAATIEAAAREHRLLFEANPLPMWVYDTQTLGFLAVNDAALAQYGWTREEFLAMTIADIRPPEDTAALRSAAQRAADAHRLRAGVWRHRRRDGSVLLVDITSHPIQFGGRSARLVLAHEVTERIESDRRWRELAARLQDYLRSSPAVYYALKVSGGTFTAEWISDNVERLWGYSVAQVLAPNWWRTHVHPDDLEAALQAAQRALSDGHSAHEYRFRDALGRWHWVHDQMHVDVGPDGAPLRVVGAWTNVSDRRAAQAALAASEQRYRMIFEHAAVGIGEVDPDGRWLAANDYLCRILGYTHDELMQLTFRDTTPPEDVDALRTQMGKVRSGQLDAYSGEKRCVCKGGAVRATHLSFAALREATAVRSFVVAVVDVSERKRAEEALRKLSRAVQQTSEAIIITDTVGTIEFVNDAFVQVTGYGREQTLGRNPRLLQSGKTPAATYASLWQTLRSGHTWRGEFVNRRSDGTEFIWAATISPVRDADGMVTHYVGVTEDVTQRRLADQELQRYREQLETMVAERTQQLEQARAQAEAANRAKGEFLANMSHEIRTPLNGVLGMLEMLERSRLSDQQYKMLRTARESGQTLLAIIDDILDFSRIEAGRLPIEPAQAALADLVETLAESMVPVALRREVDVSVFVDPSLPASVWIDPLRVRQILFNLLGNAIKFSGGRTDRRGWVRVRVTPAPDAPQTLQIAVIDNGIGMSEQTMAQLFTPFSQGEGSTTRRYGGSGLGLAICRRLTELMGGQIEVNSCLGEGSTFVVTLPAPAATPPAPAAFDLTGVHCLLTPTHALDIDGMRTYLEHAGAHVQIVRDAIEGATIAHSIDAPVVAIRDVGATLPRAGSESQGAANLRYLLLTRGRRRRARLLSPHALALDAVALRRAALLRAVAAAAGRASPDMASDAPHAPLALTRPSGRQAPILVAEDDEVNRLVIARQLEALGCVAEFAVDGLDALQRLQSGRYALLLTDLHMPQMDGYALASRIRQHEAQSGATTRLPIVALTANALRGEDERARRAGIDEFLTKPLSLTILAAALERWLAGSACALTAVAAAPPPQAAAAVFDPRVLTDMIGADAAAQRAVLAAFLESGIRLSAQIESAASDPVRVAAVAHQLKSAARSVGALALGHICDELERAARAGDDTAVAQRIAAFVQAWAAARGAIEVALAQTVR